jgi:glycosyltransferase involved in cell wall biosynthesis
MLAAPGGRRDVDDFSVALVGPYPPPHGGLSVHIARLHRRLTALGIRSRLYCQPLPASWQRREGIVPATFRFRWYGWVVEHAWRCDADIVHFYEGWSWAPAALVALRSGRKVVMAFHNQRVTGEMWQRASRLARWASRRLVRHPRAWWVGATPAVKGQLIEMGVDPARITVAPAYLPPRAGASAADLPAPIRDFVAARSPVLSSYAWQLSRDARGVDVYGFDQCLEVVRSLRAEFPGIGLVLRMSKVADAAHFRDLQARVAAWGLGEHVLFTTEALEDADALWRASHVFVRATNTDGDAVAVREALDLRVPVVASDVSARPDGAVLFRTRDAEDLARAVRDVLTHHADHVRALQSVAVVDNFPPLLELYRAIA